MIIVLKPTATTEEIDHVIDKIKGLAFDTFGNLYVADAQQGVHILNPNRQPLMIFGGQPLVNTPNAIAIDPRNHIFVSDFGLNRVHEFRLVNTTAEDSFLKTEAAAPKAATGDAKPAEKAGAEAPGATPPGAAPAN